MDSVNQGISGVILMSAQTRGPFLLFLSFVFFSVPSLLNAIIAPLAWTQALPPAEQQLINGGSTCPHTDGNQPGTVCQYGQENQCPGSQNCAGTCGYNCAQQASVIDQVGYAFDYVVQYNQCADAVQQVCLTGIFVCYCGDRTTMHACSIPWAYAVQSSTCY